MVNFVIELNSNKKIRKKVRGCAIDTLDGGAERGFLMYHNGIEKWQTTKIFFGHVTDCLDMDIDPNGNFELIGSYHTHVTKPTLSLIDIGTDIGINGGHPAKFSALTTVSEMEGENYIPIKIFHYDYSQNHEIKAFSEMFEVLDKMMNKYNVLTIRTLREEANKTDREKIDLAVNGLKKMRSGGNIFKEVKTTNIKYR